MRLTLQQIFRLRTIPAKTIRTVIPPRQTLRESATFNYLLIIGANKGLTATAIRQLAGTNNPRGDLNIAHLVDLGMIESVLKSYWVAPLHAWRVNKVYQITNQGKNAVNKLFEPILQEFNRENSEIDTLITI